MAIRTRNRANSNRFNNLGINNINQNNQNNYNNYETNMNNSNDENIVNEKIQFVQEKIDEGILTTLDNLFQRLKNSNSANYSVADALIMDLLMILIHAPNSEILRNFNNDELKELYNFRGAMSMKLSNAPYYQVDLYNRIQELQNKIDSMNQSGKSIPSLLPKILNQYIAMYRELTPSGGRRHTRRRKSKRTRKTKLRRSTK